ncbi:hypothetical protein [Kitasatospora sp. NBC_00315]|uniref:BACON domain-containing protein n=1 Tax=Kitasatospora sp. NBC_00315 TaxID=2975963 RepID=UPI0032443709
MTTRVERPPDPVLAAYDRQLDGLFTYCLSVLCDHDAAVGAVREVRELALRHGERLAEPGLVKAWLYSLARYCCLYRLERGPQTPTADAVGTERADRADRRRELASLAWPEAAGTDPEQREALELSARHRLSPIEVAAVLGISADGARALLASAGSEVGRTRTALQVLGAGGCPELDRLGGAGAGAGAGAASLPGPHLPDGGRGERVLGPALRRELVQHVVDCPTCRGTAERVAGEVGSGPSGRPVPPLLPLLPAPAAARDTGQDERRPAGGPAPLRSAGDGRDVPSGAGRDAPERSGPERSGPERGDAGQRESARGDAGQRGGAPQQGQARSGAAGRPFAGARPGGPAGSGPGAAGAAGSGPRPAGAAFLAGAAAGRRAAALTGHRPAEQPGLRFDQRGFPRHRTPGPSRAVAVRQRVITTGVLAAVLAAPVVALWAGHRSGDGAGTAAAVSSVSVDGGAPAAGRPPASGPTAGATTAGQGSGGLEPAGTASAETLFPRIQGPAVPVPAAGATPIGSPALRSVPSPAPFPGAAPQGAAGLLTVEAAEYGSRTVISMTNSGGTEIRWHAVVDVGWLRLSRDSGTLAPGQRITVTVTVDEEHAPGTAWTARIALPPSEAVVTLEGGPTPQGGASGPAPTSSTAPPGSTPTSPTEPAPTTSPSPVPTPTGGPTASPTTGPSATATSGPTTSGPATGAPASPAASPSPNSPPAPTTRSGHQQAGHAAEDQRSRSGGSR